MAKREPKTVEELDTEILDVSQERDRLRDRSLELHARRDDLLRGGRVDGLLDGLSDADRAALRERLAEREDAHTTT